MFGFEKSRIGGIEAKLGNVYDAKVCPLYKRW